ncbi:general transcription factor II-I repeat domain-containing protein 2 [Trichonephila clavipes]|nr:general transcription factor II-I repeat domain-containing protein 2 [Trichonephila clavipes]
MKANLIASRYECPRCKKEMCLQERKGTVDGYEWRCRNQSKDNRHDVVRSVRKGTWFSESKLAITIILRLTRYWFVRWLTRGKVLERVINLLPQVKEFVASRNEVYEELENKNWLLDLGFLVDMTMKFNELILKLQGKNSHIADMISAVNSFKYSYEIQVEEQKHRIETEEYRHFLQMMKKGCVHSRRESITGKSPTSFPEENTSMPYSGFESEPTQLQAEGHSHHIAAVDLLNC